MSSKAKLTKLGTTFKFGDATRKAFEAEEKTYFDLWRKVNPEGVKYGQLEKSVRETLGAGRWDAANRLVALKCVEEDITSSLKSVDEWKKTFVKRFQRRHEKLVEPSIASVPSLPVKVLDRLVDGLLDITSGRKLFREKEATAIDRRRGQIQGKNGVTNVHVGAWAVAEAELWDALSQEQKELLHHEAQSQNDVSREDLPDLLSQLAGGLRQKYDPCLLTLICSVSDSSGQPQTIVVDSVPDGTDSSTDTISQALELRLPCSIAAIANEKAKDVFDGLRKGEQVPRFVGTANEMDSSLSSAIGEVAEYFQTVWAHAYGEDAIPWSDIKKYFDSEQWVFPGGLKDPALYDSWADLSPMLAYLRAHCGPSAVPAFEFVSQHAPSPVSAKEPGPCFISDVTEKNSTLREALGQVKHFFEALWAHTSLDGPILWDDINDFYDTTRWSFPGGAFDPAVLCTSWASLGVYLNFLRTNCGPEAPNRFHFRNRLPIDLLDENGPRTPSENSFFDPDTAVVDGNGVDESRNIEHSGSETDGSHDNWAVDVEDLFDKGTGTYIGHKQKSDSSSDDGEPEESVDNEAVEPEIIEPSVTEREYEQPKIGGRKRKREPEPNVAKDDDEPPKKAKRRPGRPKAVVAPATIPDPNQRKGGKKATRVMKINGARYAETTSPPRHFVPKVLETRLRNRTSAKQV